MNLKQLMISKLKTPSLILKIILISIVFVFAINIELDTVIGFSYNTVGKNDISSTLFVMHIFSYFEVYAKYLIIALIMIIPDIVQDPYLINQNILLNKDRKKYFINTMKLMALYILCFILWFVILTFVFSLFRVRFFDFTWPELIKAMQSKTTLASDMTLISIPISATKYPFILVFFLIMLKVYIGFFVVSLISFYFSFKKGNSSAGISVALVIYLISDLLFWNSSFYWSIGDKIFSLGKFTYNYSLCTFFTFESVGVNFMDRIIHSYIYGGIIIVIFMILIKRQFNKKDLC